VHAHSSYIILTYLDHSRVNARADLNSQLAYRGGEIPGALQRRDGVIEQRQEAVADELDLLPAVARQL
jgi:hypothetical protein